MRSRLGSVALLVFLVVLVNAPLARSLWTDLRLSRDGVREQVAVIDATERDDAWYLAVDLDPDQVVRVDEATYREAVADGEVGTRRLPGSGEDPEDTDVVRVDGQVRSPVAYVVVGALDVVILAVVVLLWRVRPRLRPDLVLRATADLEPAPAGAVLDRVEAQSYVVAGVVVPADAGPAEHAEHEALLLDLGDRRVRVLLDGHTCPVPEGGTARAHGVMVG